MRITNNVIRLTPEERQAGINAKKMRDETAKKLVFICMVDWSKVQVDSAYQRKADENHANRMAEKDVTFSPYPILSFSNGKLFAVDGQHRTMVNKKKGKPGLAVVIYNMTQAESALLFNTLQNQKQQSPWSRFRAACVAQQERELTIERTAKAYGLTLGHEVTKGADLGNLPTLLDAYQNGVLENFCYLIAKLIGENGEYFHPSVTSRAFQWGLVSALKLFGTINRRTLNNIFNAIEETGLASIKIDAEERSASCDRAEKNHWQLAIMDVLKKAGIVPPMAKAA